MQSHTPRRPFLRIAALTSALLILATASAFATTNKFVFDFETDPVPLGAAFFTQNALSGNLWEQPGGANAGGNPGGYLRLANALANQRTTVVFQPATGDPNEVIGAFGMSMDLRIGNGTTPNPADGFSINYARNSDALVVAANAIMAGGSGNINGSWAVAPSGGSAVPEEGTKTGLAIGFDLNSNGSGDVVGISILVDNVLITNIAMYSDLRTDTGQRAPADLVDPCNDARALVTGPYDTSAPGSASGLCWQPLWVNLDADGTLDITFKNKVLLTNFATTFFPSPGRLAMGCRTGSRTCNMHVDNIVLTTITAGMPVISGIVPWPSGFNVGIVDQAGASPRTNTITLAVDGTNVPITAITREGAYTIVGYSIYPNTYANGSVHAVRIAFTDSNGVKTDQTLQATIPTMTTLPQNYALPSSAFATAKPGYKARVYQMPIARGPNDGNLLANGERALANGYIDPETHQPFVNSADPTLAGADGFFVDDGVINLNQSAPAAAGLFSINSTPPFEDKPVPGIPGFALAPNDNYVVEFQTYLLLDPGVYRFGVNSDDSFQISVTRSPGDVTGTVLASQVGTGNKTFDFAVTTQGYYPFRLLWLQGGGSGFCEFYMVNLVTGENRLLNDLSVASPIRMYRESALTYPYVSRVLPTSGATNVVATADVLAEITDGSVAVNASSASLALNGVPLGNPTKNGKITSFRQPGSVANLLVVGINNAQLIYSFTSGSQTVTVTNNWNFTVDPYAIIPPGNKVPANSVDLATPGFKARVNQIDMSGDGNQANGGRYVGQGGNVNSLPRPEIQLDSGYLNPTNNQPYPNVADLTFLNPDGTFDILDFINYNLLAGNAGAYTGDIIPPGIPGHGTSPTTAPGTDNYVMEVLTYLDLKAGTYMMCVNSDDGYLLSSAPNPRDTLGTVVSQFSASLVASPPTRFFTVIVLEDGLYPFRLLYWQGGGGASVEWFSADPNSGQRFLVNDLNSPYSIKAYRLYTGSARPWVKFSVSPTPWDNRAQQAGPGPILIKVPSGNPPDGSNQSDATRPWADVGIGAVIANLGNSSVGMLLNGSPVTPTLTPSGSDTVVVYQPSPPLPSGSTNTASLVYAGVTNSWTFIVQTYTNIPESLAQPLTAGDPNAPGFRARVMKIQNGASGIASTLQRAEDQLRGVLTNANTAALGPESDGSYLVPGILNWNKEMRGGNNVEAGNFRSPAYRDDPVPGIGLGTTGEAASATDLIAAEVFAYLQLPAGYAKLGVAGDDGFRVTAATGYSTNAPVLGVFDGTKSQTDVPFSFLVPKEGLYPLRLVWFQNTGGANLEFFSYGPKGEKIPINDRSNPASIKAFYQIVTAPVPPLLSVSRQADGTLKITFDGRLQATDSLSPIQWQDVGISSPYPVTPAGSARYFRAVNP